MGHMGHKWGNFSFRHLRPLARSGARKPHYKGILFTTCDHLCLCAGNAGIIIQEPEKPSTRAIRAFCLEKWGRNGANLQDFDFAELFFFQFFQLLRHMQIDLFCDVAVRVSESPADGVKAHTGSCQQ